MSATKIGENTTSILNHYVLNYIHTLAHQTKYLSACRKLNSLLRNSICMVLSFLEMQRRLIQTKVHYAIFYSVSKETTQKPSKVATAENVSFSVDVTDTTCFTECFLFYLIDGSHCFL